ncbi:MAG: hypothetical protein VW258_11460 [Thalassolituus sp.]
MSIWASEQTQTVQTENGPKLNVKTYVDEQVTDASGNATFDLSGLEAKEIICYQAGVLNIAGVTGIEEVSQSLTEIVLKGKQENIVTVTLGLLLEPFKTVSAGETIKLAIQYR